MPTTEEYIPADQFEAGDTMVCGVNALKIISVWIDRSKDMTYLTLYHPDNPKVTARFGFDRKQPLKKVHNQES